jgi:hypothetical protein
METIKTLFITLFAAFGVVVGMLALIFGLSALFALPVYYIVNYLFSAGVLTAVFGSAKITFWQAFWLNILSGFLFKSSTGSKESK